MAQVVPPFSATAIEMVCRALGEAVTGAQIPNLIASLKVNEEPGEDRNTKWKRLHNAVVKRQNIQQDGRPLVAIVLHVMNPVRFNNPADFEDHRISVNERLLFSGLEVGQDGRVHRVTQAATLSDAQGRASELSWQHPTRLRRRACTAA